MKRWSLPAFASSALAVSSWAFAFASSAFAITAALVLVACGRHDSEGAADSTAKDAGTILRIRRL